MRSRCWMDGHENSPDAHQKMRRKMEGKKRIRGRRMKADATTSDDLGQEETHESLFRRHP